MNTAMNARWLPAGMVILLLAGCGGDPMDRRAELEARPGLEQAIAHYEDMLAGMRSLLSAELGPYEWSTVDEPSAAGCGAEFSGLGGATASTERWWFRQNLPDDAWPRAVQIVTEVAARYGFGAPAAVVDRPGDHEVASYDRFGANLVFGTRGATVLRVGSGCHLPDAARVSPPAPR